MKNEMKMTCDEFYVYDQNAINTIERCAMQLFFEMRTFENVIYATFETLRACVHDNDDENISIEFRDLIKSFERLLIDTKHDCVHVQTRCDSIARITRQLQCEQFVRVNQIMLCDLSLCEQSLQTSRDCDHDHQSRCVTMFDVLQNALRVCDALNAKFDRIIATYATIFDYIDCDNNVDAQLQCDDDRDNVDATLFELCDIRIAHARAHIDALRASSCVSIATKIETNK